MNHDENYLKDLVHELIKAPKETNCLEFKINNSDPQAIGEYISALANSAALTGTAQAYLLWGVEDLTHKIVGTDFEFQAKKIGNEELENWLLRQLTPKINFQFLTTTIEDKKIVILKIDRAFQHPVQFCGVEYIRIGSYKKKLKEFQEKERELWRVLDKTPFEFLAAEESLGAEDVIALLDYPTYFAFLGRPLPNGHTNILDALASDRLIGRQEGGRWTIFNLGALLFSRHLSSFVNLKRKVVRVITYKGINRLETLKEKEIDNGYAAGFETLIALINSLLPSNEVIGPALRREVPVYPELAIRELVANALIHQDFSVTGSGPMIEIFSDRMEITNPGKPLVDPQRFLDYPPRSRNEALASLMRRFGICEERGSGVDKVVFQAEFYQLPAPSFEIVGDSTRSALFSLRPLTKMARSDRIRAVYLHACLKYVQQEFMTNASLRERFGIESKNTALASRLLKEASLAGVVRLEDESAALKLRKYVPSWA